MLVLKNVKKTYDRRIALEDIFLEIPTGSIFALLGPNGSGKTTLLKSIIGSVLIEPGGEIIMNNSESVFSFNARRKLVYMTQTPNYPAHLKTLEIIELIESLRNDSASLKTRLIQELGIDQFWNKRFGDLSGGMKQKLNLLLCFMFDFEIALLDEPTSSLDPQIAFYIKNLMRKLSSQGRTMLFTSHIMAEVEEIADRMALLFEGKIYLERSPSEFIKESGKKNLEEALLDYWRALNVN